MLLVSLVNSPEWALVLDLMEAECVRAETKLLNAPEDDDKKVLAFHKTAKAAWAGFVGFQKTVNKEVEAGLAMSALDKPRRPLPQETAEQILTGSGPSEED